MNLIFQSSGAKQKELTMQFSRAMAYAAFTAMKWLMIVAVVLFAALAVRMYFDPLQSANVGIAGFSCVASAVLAYVMHALARKIAP